MQKQSKCPNCGPTLAVSNPPMTCAEHVGMGLLTACTCGFGLLLAIPYAAHRGHQTKVFRCQKCGEQCK